MERSLRRDLPPEGVTGGAVIRDATQADFEAVLRLNERWQHLTSPLDTEALAHLHDQSSYHRVLESGGVVVAFLLAFGPGADYDSPNYRWFDSNSSGFIYIDRVAVDPGGQRQGFGRALYDDVFAFARALKTARVTCEVDVEPLNEASLVFHKKRGFVEIGTQWVAGGSKRVSLLEYRFE